MVYSSIVEVNTYRYTMMWIHNDNDFADAVMGDDEEYDDKSVILHPFYEF